ncbi:hypothetical protein IGB42_01845 [Andreprevotia sp. IGB-42]|uniref:hypothetical protein n=1 Tax=Andreprevotia sp. IGB-42 TaxID=2497473 RepID=UPI00135A0406|nr:hypothetical protein [Andreprevotia sp. IGB-42]KAF0813494.1 hypothetical protein IGB42_01845 [Andreprevotia sp. IGB-42]
MAESPFDGAWQLVTGECIDDGHLLDYDTLDIKSRKVLADGHFTFISYQKGAFWSAGSGRFRVDGAVYTESPDMGTYPPAGFRDYVFKARLDGNDWHNERWEDGVRVEYELWQRIAD